MDRNSEIRHMSSHLQHVADILDKTDGWREIISLIPKNIDDISSPRPTPKYTGFHEDKINEVSRENKLSPSKLLLEEWSISGRVRPTVGNLLTILIRANQIRAAEYLSSKLEEAPPERPRNGPAAPIDIRLPEDYQTESMLDGMSYPQSSQLLNGSSITNANNRDYYDKMGPTKRVVIEDPVQPPVDPKQPANSCSNNNTPELKQNNNAQLLGGPANEETNQSQPADDLLPSFSKLMDPSDARTSGQMDESSKLQNDRDVAVPQSVNHAGEPSYAVSLSDMPRFDLLRDTSSESHVLGASSHNDIPMLSIMGTNSESSVSIENSMADSTNTTPALSIFGRNSLNQSQEQNSDNSGVSNASNSGAMGDLMKFSVIEFSYDHLERVTDMFNRTVFTNRDTRSPNGRWIGAGGFGAVFLAINLTPTVPVAAVKRLESGTYKYLEKFQRERTVLAAHSHPNILSLLGSCSNGLQPCLVYEYMQDGDLETALLKMRASSLHLGGARRLKYLQDIASAIHYLHARANVIHRDVKSANILLNGSVAKLCDFGLLKPTSSTTETKIIGTSAYIAPEAVRGSISVAMDVYAFGIVIAETVTGEAVFADDGSRSECNLDSYIRRHRGEGRNLASLVDRRAIGLGSGEERWLVVGSSLLEMALKCLEDTWCRPTSGVLVSQISEMRM
ncbi:probable serine/threonine-protein kinase DDB_G0267514 [Anopheles aquasalis]|uniref:probable serine/threonine-protein kinase DDB_G0267514 n=1 Tax=Anopheles aquasalis TaxID=42839 RepID=UPI00215A92E8|nr:probable serine/threonine-protein kinase DDB_G0267514 [Anopheles aquasalis]